MAHQCRQILQLSTAPLPAQPIETEPVSQQGLVALRQGR